MADIQYKSVQRLTSDGKVTHFLSPIDLSQIEDDLIGAIWLQETLNGIRNKQTRWIMEMYFTHDLIQEDIAELLGISRQRVSQIMLLTLAKLRAKARRGGS